MELAKIRKFQLGQLQVNAARVSHFLDAKTLWIFASFIAVRGRPWDIKVQ